MMMVYPPRIDTFIVRYSYAWQLQNPLNIFFFNWVVSGNLQSDWIKKKKSYLQIFLRTKLITSQRIFKWNQSHFVYMVII